MTPIRFTLLSLLLVIGSLGMGRAHANGAQREQGTTGLGHEPAPCMDTETFPLLEVRMPEAETEAGAASDVAVRFRAEDAADWHEISLEARADSLFRGAILKPQPEAARVHYYFVWGRPEARSNEFVVNVLRGGCPGANNAPAELTEGIRVRRTSSGQDALPRGFSPEGMAEGPSSRLTLGAVAGGVAGAGVAAIVISGDEPVEPPPAPPDPGAPRACFAPDPVPDIDSGDTLRFDASCTTPASVTSFEWDFGDGATAQGSSVEHVFSPGGIFTVTLTVRDGTRSDTTSRVVRVIATPTACFVTNPNPPRITARQSIDFNAECSVGDRDGGPSPVMSYAWDFGDDRPGTDGVFVSRQFAAPDVYGVTLTVTNGDGRQHQTTQFVVVEDATASVSLTFTSLLELSGGGAAQVTLNGTESFSVPAGAIARYQARTRSRSGENTVEARLLSPSREEGRWQFDFTETAGFVAGSLRVASGHVLTLDGSRVVFRLGDGENPAIRFRFRTEE